MRRVWQLFGIAAFFLSASMATEAVKTPVSTATKAVLEAPVVLATDHQNGKITPKTIEATFEKAGFFINDNRNMLAPFKKNFGKTHHDVYNLFTIFKKDMVLKLVKKYPNIGLFTPMSMSIWVPKGGKKIYVSRLSAKSMAAILGIPADDADLLAYTKLVEDTLKKALPGATVVKPTYAPSAPKGPLVYTKSIKIPDGADAEDFKDEFESEKFESALPPAEFIMAGFNDLNYDFSEAKYDAYTFYDVYSICNLEVIYTVSQTHPEAGAFAPCSLYMYNKDGESTIEVGFPTVYNWIATMHMEDEASINVLLKAQKRMERILSKLAGEKVEEPVKPATPAKKVPAPIAPKTPAVPAAPAAHKPTPAPKPVSAPVPAPAPAKKCGGGKCGKGKCGGSV